MAQAEKVDGQSGRNPLIIVSLIVVGLIVFIFTLTDRGGVEREKVDLAPPVSETTSEPQETASDGQISREVVAPPGELARDSIREFRDGGKPYPFDKIMARASEFASDGSLADAHLMFFFAAREGHVDAMMMMAEMSDPTLFRAENNLLDRADPVQAYKWYREALDLGFEPARARLDNLKNWAEAEAGYGNVEASQLLLNFN
jgi:TPR repeat protein